MHFTGLFRAQQTGKGLHARLAWPVEWQCGAVPSLQPSSEPPCFNANRFLKIPLSWLASHIPMHHFIVT